ncbi:hypothetical protein BDR26DRAFT_850048 [Obelidium mucronatum]|nr:hypothetical protein BDR26DRAFT_850048 [Obelidium mucronatum]
MPALPPELLAHISALVPTETIKQLRLVNTTWLSVANNTLFRRWHPRTLQSFFQLIEEHPSQNLPSWKRTGCIPSNSAHQNRRRFEHPIACLSILDLSLLIGRKSQITDSTIHRFIRQRDFYTHNISSINQLSTRLVSINLMNCFVVTDSSFTSLIQANPFLNTVLIAGCTGLTDKSLYAVSKVLVGIVWLDVSLCLFTADGINAVLNSPSLKDAVCEKLNRVDWSRVAMLKPIRLKI